MRDGGAGARIGVVDCGPGCRWGLWAVVALAAILRLAMFPHPGETRDLDEPGYLKGSLAILEGLPAGYKAAPAGPNLWVGWAYAGVESAWHVVHPAAQERRVPMQVRPFVAIEHTLFDNYRDLGRLHALWVGTQLILAVWAVAAGFRYGYSRGGLAGGLLIGGLLASMPLLVDFCDMSRPYATAWSFGVGAAYWAKCKEKRPEVGSGVLLGLAVASRVEMLIFAPLVFWELWDRRKEIGLSWCAWITALGILIISTLVAAPWLITHLVGNLRTIATVRLGVNPRGPTTLLGIMRELAIEQGLIGTMLLSAAAFFVQDRGRRWRVWLLGAFLGILILSMSKGTVFLHQQGPTILVLILFSAMGIGPLAARWPKLCVWAAVALLVLPVAQAARLAAQYRQNYAPDLGVQWVQDHVPPGTRLYVQYSMHEPLPTAQASDFLWEQVSGVKAAETKFRSGLARFNLNDDLIPRALGEENLVQEQGNRRGWYIMGGSAGTGPRYDVRVFGGSPVFDILDKDLAPQFAATGGVVIFRGSNPPPELGSPTVKWIGASGAGCFVFCSPNIARQLAP